MAFPFVKALLIGTVAGMRCMSAPAIVAASIDEKDHENLGTLALIGDPRAQRVLDLAAGVELAADKLPQIGSRIKAGPLAARAVSGAVCGAAVSRANRENALLGALTGGITAVFSAHIFYAARKHANVELGIPNPLLAVAEDTTAWTLGRIAVRKD